MKKHLLFSFLLAVSGVLLVRPQAHAQYNNYQFHSIYIYNFTKYIQWPAGLQQGDFVIGVLGNATVAGELEKVVANKSVGSQQIVVKRFKSVAEISSCHILFIPGGSGDFDAVKEVIRGRPTLIITEKSGLAQKGSAINFVLQDNKWKFELNELATQNAGLKVSKELTKLAITV